MCFNPATTPEPEGCGALVPYSVSADNCLSDNLENTTFEGVFDLSFVLNQNSGGADSIVLLNGTTNYSGYQLVNNTFSTVLPEYSTYYYEMVNSNPNGTETFLLSSSVENTTFYGNASLLAPITSFSLVAG